MAISIAVGVFLGGLVLVIVLAFLSRLSAEQAVREFAQDSARVQAQALVHTQAQNHLRQVNVAARLASLRLSSDERCIGGTVMRYSLVAGVPAYEQELESLRPVPCSGNSRLRSR